MRLYRYLFKRFIPVFLGAMFFFSFLLVLIDLLMNMTKYLSYEVPVVTIFKICVLYIPQTIAWALPLSMLFAVTFTLSMLYSNSELTVIFASGISLLRFTRPLLFFSLILSLGFFYFQDKIVIPYYAQKVELQDTVLKKVISYDNNNVVIQTDGGRIVYKANSYNDTKKRLNSLFIIIRNSDNTLNKIIYAKVADWKETHWVFKNEITYTVKKDKILIDDGSDFESFEPPETFQNITVNVNEVDSKTAKIHISKLQRTGLPYEEALSQYYAKFSFPLIIFIVVLFSIGLTGKFRKNILLSSTILCVSATVIFYVMQMIFMWLAHFGYVTPLMGAWITVITFIIASIILLLFTRT